jgi:hypothetical protein
MVFTKETSSVLIKPAPLPDGAKKSCECGGGSWYRAKDGTAQQVPHNKSHPVHSDR